MKIILPVVEYAYITKEGIQMRKLLSVLLAIVVLVVGMCGCGNPDADGTEKPESGKVTTEGVEKTEPNLEYIDGFEKAEYERFNSRSIENGLYGTLISQGLIPRSSAANKLMTSRASLGLIPRSSAGGSFIFLVNNSNFFPTFCPAILKK